MTPITEDYSDLIGESCFLRGIPAAAVTGLMTTGKQRVFKRGEVLFRQNDKANVIWLVADGCIKLYRIAPNGKEAVVRLCNSGVSMGEAVALQAHPYPVTGVAIEPSKVLCFDAQTLLQLIAQDPAVAVAMLSATYYHFQDLIRQIERLKSQTGSQRLAAFLLDLCGEKTGRVEVQLPYDKTLIAAQLGIKPESLSRAFAKLRDFGVSTRQHLALIGDVGKLRRFALHDSGKLQAEP